MGSDDARTRPSRDDDIYTTMRETGVGERDDDSRDARRDDARAVDDARFVRRPSWTWTRERTRAETRGRPRDGREGAFGAFGAFAFAFAVGGGTVSEGTCDAKAEAAEAKGGELGGETRRGSRRARRRPTRRRRSGGYTRT